METQMRTWKHLVLFVVPLLLGVLVVADGECVLAQTNARGPSVGVTVQLPVFRFHSVRTAVSVPDGGTINLGGVGGSSYGQSRRSGFGRPPRGNRFGGGAASGVSLSTKIALMKEFERQIQADHAARRSPTGDVQVNGSQAVQSQADFISRHVGR